jgi:HK97 family phage major capsid protein
LNGDGAGKPLGILNSDSIIEISKETGREADTVIYDNLRKMEARLLPKCMLRAVWIANNSTFPQLSMLSQEVGMGGTALKALTRQNNQYYLLDRPISFTEKAPALGDAGDIVLADLSMYYIGMRQEILMDMSNAPGWITDTIDFRVICRVDGLPILSQAFTPKNGDSLSWAVKIEARA